MAKKIKDLFPDLERAIISRSRKDILSWRSALQAAENAENPKRLLLYNIYDEILLDLDLEAEINKRILSITGSAFKLYDESGTPNVEATDMLKKTWFIKLLETYMETIFWGHSLIEVKSINVEGMIDKLELIPRRHVKPEFGMVLKKQDEDTGVVYRDNAKFENYLFEFGEKYDLGLLNKITPYILFIRFATSAWSEFSEVFGQPHRVIHTNTQDTNNLNRLENMLVEQAASSYSIISVDEKLEYIEAVNSEGTIYDKLIKRCLNSIMKAINGAVIGDGVESGSRAKEEIGKELKDLIVNADKREFQSWMNEYGIPKLVLLGYPFDGLTFEFETTKDIDKEWKMVGDMIAKGLDVDVEYIQENFGIPIKGYRQTNATSSIDAKGDSDFFG